MPSTTFPIGVASVLLPSVSNTALPSFAALSFSAAGITPTATANNSGRSPLSTAATYQVILTPLGLDKVNGGYTVGVGSAASSSISSSSAIKISITNANLLALGGAVGELFAISIWIKTGTGRYKLAEHAYVDPSTDFVHTVTTAPRLAALTRTPEILTAATSDAELGSRSAYGCTFAATPTTTGGVNITRASDKKIPYRPDTWEDFEALTSKTVSVNFNTLSNDPTEIAKSNISSYVKYTHSSVEYEEVGLSEYTIVPSLPGPQPLILIMPPDTLGYQAVRLYLGLQNQESSNEATSKDNQAETRYSFEATYDTLMNNTVTEIHWKKKA